MSRIILGIQPVREALRAHGKRVSVMLERGESKALAGLARQATDAGAELARVERRELDRVAQGTRHQGAAARAPDLILHELEDLPFDEDSVVTVLDGITDPQNFGAVIRSAVALGDGTVLWGRNHAAPLTPATFRASAGAVEHARLCQVQSIRKALATLADQGFTTIALDGSAPQTLVELDAKGPVALVVGSEGSGIQKGVRNACAARARLPIRTIDSLNASVAAAVALYELSSRRRG